jgi:NitT/TauT family transport system ATP-binding protein
VTDDVPRALIARHVALHYPGNAQAVLSDFSLELSAGEVITILGPSGAGKSSLLRVLAGLQSPSGGSVEVADGVLSGVHPRLAITFQNPGLLPWLDLEKNVGFGLNFKTQPKLSRQERQQRVDAAIGEVGLSYARHLRPNELSGGMAQRAALARCLARQPRVLLLDEPFGALDEVTRSEMQQLLLKVIADFGTAAILVTHDIDEALLVSDRIVLLGGSPAHQIADWIINLPKPRADYVAELGALRIEILRTLRNAVLRH